MNNLTQLNSKWYWRLIKVIWILLYIWVFIWSSVGLFIYFSHYAPSKLEKANNIIKEKSRITNSLEYIKNELPWKDLKLSDFKKIIDDEQLNNVNAIAINFVMIEFLWKEMNQIKICGKTLYLWCSWNPVWTYIKDSINDKNDEFVISISKDTYQEAKDTFEDYYNAESKAINWINNLINWEYVSEWDAFYNFNNKFEVNINDVIGYEYEYRSLLDYFKLISSIIWILLWIFVFNFILLRIIYYIVLWKIFPKKD